MTAREFDPIDAPLSGTSVVEANAGTGKTHTITALYVRLLLESALPVESILVVTFTEAATGELRDRVRKRVAETFAAFERGTAAPDDAFIAKLLTRVTDRNAAMLRLTAALREFDQAPIYTIHGFCQRVLSDSAFETGAPFRTQIVPDQSAIVREVVEDFWRTSVSAATPLFARYLAQERLGPDKLIDRDTERYLSKPYLEIRRPQDPGDTTGLERAYASAYADARAIWQRERAAVEKKLIGNSALHAARYKAASLPVWFDEMARCLESDMPPLELCKSFGKFTTSALHGATNKGRITPTHSFFDACEALAAAHAPLKAAFAAAVALLKVRAIEYCNTELAARKKRRQLESYDDLLLDVHAALHGASGEALAAQLRKRYQGALIDEFQDTDPVQFEIFRHIYGGGREPLFLVGDPKQSIYSFRGADVYAYIGARESAQHRHTLDVNWRSSPALLNAVNRVFQGVEHPFLIEAIPFRASRAAPQSPGQLVIDGAQAAGLDVWLLDESWLTKGQARDVAAKRTAGEIARLMELGRAGRAHIVDRDGNTEPLSGGHVAVLARSHHNAEMMRQALAARGIAAVQRGSASVFASREAEELDRVLAAIAEPGHEARVSAALLTELMGYDGNALYALREDARAWEDIVESFREAHRSWHESGFVSMLRGFLARHRVLPRLLEYADGERRATNLLHLSELLQCDAAAQGIGAVLTWFAAKRAAPAESNEAELLRLESDEDLVKIFTVHASKGLEFPVVFLPFAWDGSLRSEEKLPIQFHHGDRTIVDYGSPGAEASRPQAVLEERAESLRLFYVAVTRAKYRCTMIWGNVNELGKAAPTWLLHGDTAAPKGDRLRADLLRLEQRAEGAVRVMPAPQAGEAPLVAPVQTARACAAREFSGTLRDARSVTSFTALAHGRSIEAPDYDASDRAPLPESVSGRDIFAFPRGAHAGKCLHAIFEDLDFGADHRGIEDVVHRALFTHGFDAAWSRGVTDMIGNVLDTPLDGASLQLRGVTRQRRLDELEFYYPIARMDAGALRRVLAQHDFPAEVRERIEALTFAPARGYMRGFIDLTFEHAGRYYIADYKSNWLGPTVAAYDLAAMSRVMAREAYYLQYLVYCVAAHRYLKLRVPRYSYDTHFGGVYYLFLRGMRPDAGAHGVYPDRPAAALIEALDRYLEQGHA